MLSQMTNQTLVHATAGGTHVPGWGLLGDFRLLVDVTTLGSLVDRAVDAVCAQLPPLSGDLAATNHKRLLRLLTYSYCICAFATEDIHRNCATDPATRYFTENAVIDHESIRAFRRANRPWIEACLAWVISQLADAPETASACENLAPLSCELQSDSPALQLARRRLELATLLDMALAD